MNLKKPLEVIASPNRENLFYENVFREGEDIDFFVKTLEPIAAELKEKKVDYPLTIFYLSLKWYGFAFKFLEKQLGRDPYYPTTSEALPENRLFAQYHAPQTQAMKDLVLTELASPSSKVRVIFATVVMGMGVDVPSIRFVIHVGAPRSIREYMQETGRAGRDGKPSVILHFNNKDIATNRTEISDDIRAYCRLDKACLRKFLLLMPSYPLSLNTELLSRLATCSTEFSIHLGQKPLYKTV
ncbi:PREDICTED: probable Werner syndrome ATP-dependent helicase homolog 1 [Acropora digitifera]|uniref:probable Werner syndrome ATP-dependent helicase homolog 1 n=1 Tax=Acropora digitifera TaxID=70779 RepID=UPI00077A9DEC|nr:PREDICTED: probable Werner syndrome ATP-dependent helicase homolog 1 [Acropora digitifera]